MVNNDREMNIITERVASRREELNLSLQDVADKVGISKSTLQRYETGFIRNLPLSKVGNLAKALDTTPAYLMGWEEKEEPTEKGELTEEITTIFNNLPSEKQNQALDFLRFLQGK